MSLTVYTMDEVGQRLHKSRRWLQDFIRINPYYRMAGRTKLFTVTDLFRLCARLCHAPQALPAKDRQDTVLLGQRHISRNPR
jgi:hypothetical protein